MLISKQLLDVSADVRGEETVDEGIGRTVEWSKGLNECRDGIADRCLRDVAKHLEDVVQEVRTPTEYEH